MKITSIEIENILSVEKASVTFEESGLLLVDGWNHDIGRANGAGKTVIFNAISFALFDKVPRKITATEILKRGSTTGFASCVLTVGKDTWRVVRHRPKGVEFYCNGLRVDTTQRAFESVIRLTYDQFLLTMYTAQSTNGGTDRFLIKSDTDKKTFLLRLLDLEKFSACKKLADKKIDVIVADINTLKGKINNNDSKISAYVESMVDEESMEETMHTLITSLVPLRAEYDQFKSVPKPDLSKYIKLEEDARSKLQEIAQARTKREMLHDKYKTLQQRIGSGGENTCSECGSPLTTPESIKEHKERHDTLTEQSDDTRKAIGECDGRISGEPAISDMLRRIKEKKQKESLDYDRALLRISELKPFITSKEVQIDNIKSKIASNAELVSKVDKLTEANVELEAQIAAKNLELQYQEVLSVMYSPTGAQAYILDSVVDTFNDTINDYINIVWPNASYNIQSQKENSKGEMVAKFSETLMMGKDEVSVGSLSGGEFKAFSLCVDFTLLNILAKQFGIDLNPIILDEPFDGLDSIGKKIVINLLSKLAQNKQIIVVDHASEAKALFPRVIQVDKTNGTSVVSIET